MGRRSHSRAVAPGCVSSGWSLAALWLARLAHPRWIPSRAPGRSLGVVCSASCSWTVGGSVSSKRRHTEFTYHGGCRVFFYSISTRVVFLGPAVWATGQLDRDSTRGIIQTIEFSVRSVWADRLEFFGSRPPTSVGRFRARLGRSESDLRFGRIFGFLGPVVWATGR